ncbi:nitrilase-related carbon-nitrogen hydrolase [Dactylosporangium sp. NPDC000555]|uniref:nitrilase-related carbon-nitrogen hydrolase n=1 Tax=Dactylosporangium sp. NPDC000555 TaxID=3154260 RepID=UPI00331C00BD
MDHTEKHGANGPANHTVDTARLRLALAQADPTVGDLTGNSALVLAWTARAAGEGAHVVAFPQLMLTGHPVGGLALQEPFLNACRRAVDDLAGRLAERGLGEIVVLAGCLDAGAADGPGPRAATAVLYRGARVTGPADGDRPGAPPAVVRVGGVQVALAVGEDLEDPEDPERGDGAFAEARRAGAGLVVHGDAAPYELGPDDTRLALLARRATEAGATVASVNLVGGQDELVFAGDSMVVRPDGALIARAPLFSERLMVLDLDLPAAAPQPAGGPAPGHATLSDAVPEPARPAPPPQIAARGVDEAEVWQALVLGLRDYAHKNGYHSVALGLSGGIDSAVAAAIACDALGPDGVVGVSMPGEDSSAASRDDARDLALRTGLDFRVEPIQPMVDAFLANLALGGPALELLPARVRGVILATLADQERRLLLTAGDRSALAIGDPILQGGPEAGFDPLKDVPRTLVRRLAQWRNEEAERRDEPPPIPRRATAGPPAGHEALDAILAGYVDAGLGRDDLVAEGYDPGLVDRALRMVDSAEYRRRRIPPGTRISARASAREHGLPITNRFRHGRVVRPGTVPR